MKKIIIYIVSVLILSGCKKSFLDAKPDDRLVVPTTLKDLQALLDNEEFMNGSRSRGPNTALIFAGTDEYYLADTRYTNSIYQYVRNAYVWNNDNLFSGLSYVNDWASPYRTVYYANVVLDGLKNIKVDESNVAEYNNVKGSALFYRAYTFYQLAQAFAQPYNPSTAVSDFGIPIRLVADISEQSPRASVAETYARIKADLEEALTLLPVKPLFNTRPSKPAVYALLGRMYLGMENYEQALLNAQNALTIFPTLLDYNSLNATATLPMPLPIENPEVVFSGAVQSDPLGSQLINLSIAMIDSNLYMLYKDGDLRKTACFRAGPLPNSKISKGSYTKLTLPFAGIAADELYLIKAECLARKGDTDEALKTLDVLLVKRWKTGSYQPATAPDADAALRLILIERRKELLMRGTRWTDLKRLNKDNRFAITLYRNINGKQYSLPPGDNRYTWPIPDEVISFNPGMPQNPK